MAVPYLFDLGVEVSLGVSPEHLHCDRPSQYIVHQGDLACSESRLRVNDGGSDGPCIEVWELEDIDSVEADAIRHGEAGNHPGRLVGGRPCERIPAIPRDVGYEEGERP